MGDKTMASPYRTGWLDGMEEAAKICEQYGHDAWNVHKKMAAFKIAAEECATAIRNHPTTAQEKGE
jgi:hypothetical protein